MLLDGELHGKLGDFRLARCSKHEQDFQTTHEAGTLEATLHLSFLEETSQLQGRIFMHLGLYARRLPAVEGWRGKKNPAEWMILGDWVY